MAKIKGTNVAAPVVPFDTNDVHPSHEARYGKGGYRTAATTTERDAIPAARREAGMLVHVVADGKVYRLAEDLTTWGEFKSGASTWTELEGKPTTFPPQAHQHVVSDVTGLQAALDGKATPADVTTAVSAVIDAAPAALNTLNELAAALNDDANFATTVTNALAGKAAAVHTHVISDVTGLQTALDSKAASSHTHDASAISAGTLAAARLPLATTSTAGAVIVGGGLGVSSGTVSANVTSVAGRTGAVTIAAADVSGLGGAATLNVGTTAGTVAAGDHTHAQLHDRSHAITSTSDHTATNWRLFHSNGSGQVVELAFGNSGQALISNGASAAPSWGQAGSTSASDLSQGTLADARLTARARAAINVFNWSSFR